jgi:hypothetical protein
MQRDRARKFKFERLESRELLSADPVLFDFGGGALVDDENAVAVRTEFYDPGRGFGWLDDSGLILQGQPGSADQLRNDWVTGDGQSVFRVDVPNGDYVLRVTLVNSGFPYNPDNPVRVSAEGAIISGTAAANSGAATELTNVVSVDDGALDIAFERIENPWSLAGIALMPLSSDAPLATEEEPELPGDYNLDGHVSLQDLLPLLGTLGDEVTPFTGADGNGNGKIDLADLQVLLGNLGSNSPNDPPPPPPPPPPLPVPSPHHEEPIPDFAAQPTMTAVTSGNWSNPAVWSAGRVPTVSDVLVVEEGVEVVVDGLNAVTDRLVVHGTLRFATNQDTRLRVSTLHVDEEGTLLIGTEDAPVTANAQIIIRDTPLNLALDPEQYGTGLLVEGTVRMHGLQKTAFERLAAEPLAGATQLRFAAPVQGWKAGDRLYLPDTQELIYQVTTGTKYRAQYEFVDVASVSADGRTVTLVQPLKFNHLGARDGDGVLTILPHAANLTRNVRISSENPSGTRGHTMYAGHADVDMRFVEFRDLGRTTTDALDNTVIGPGGVATHIGANQIGRYSMHIHHLDGPHEPQENGYQYTLVGNVSNGGEGLHKFKWGLALHDSHYGLVQDNVLEGWAGGGLVLEDGNETENVIDGNFVGRVWGKGIRSDGDITVTGGVGYWLRGVNNHVRDNVAANVFSTADPGAGGYVLGNFYTGRMTIPSAQGSHLSIPVDPFKQSILEFDDNEFYGTGSSAITVWNVGAFGASFGQLSDGDQSVITDFTAWHYWGSGIVIYASEKVDFDGLTLLGDYHLFRDQPQNAALGGYVIGDYVNTRVVVSNANIQNHKVGIVPSTMAFDLPQTFKDSYLRNAVNVRMVRLYITGDPENIAPRKVYLDNIVFATPTVPSLGRVWKNIEMYFGNGGALNLIQKNELYVTNYNGVAGDNFRVYYYEQAADFVIPQTIPGRLVGSPEAGLTNRQNMDKYGIAISGSIAPASAVQRAGIHGLVSPM